MGSEMCIRDRLLLLFLFSHADTTCGFTTEYLDLIDYTSKQLLHCTLLHDVRVCIRIYLPACCCVVCCYTADAAAAATCCCCSSSCAGWQNLLLWSIASDPSVFFLFLQTRFIFNVPLGSTAVASIYLTNIYTSSVVTGMCGAKAGVRPTRRSPPCKYMEDNVRHVVPPIEKSDLDQVFEPYTP